MVDVYNDYQAPGEADSFMNPVGSVTNVYGRGGSLRHSGVFSPDNPYLVQLNNAVKNQDKDAWYEKAVNWEADRAKILEQREYDDPVNQVARQRAAGINPDIAAGGSGGSSISSGSSAVQEQTQGQVKPSNSYDNISLSLQAVDTAASFISGISSAASLGMNLAKDISTFGDMLSQSSSASAIARKNVELAGQQVEMGKAQIWSQNFDNTLKSYGFARDIASLFEDGTPDSEISSTLTDLGVDNVDEMLPLISQVRKSPQIQAFLQRADLQRKHAQAENEAAAYDVIQHTYAASYEAKMFDSEAQRILSGFSLAVDRAVTSQANLDKTVATANANIEAASNTASLSAQQTEFDLSAFKVQMKQLERHLNEAYDRLAQTKILFDSDPTNPLYKARLNVARNSVSRLEGSTSAMLSQMYDMQLEWGSHDFINSTVASEGNLQKGAGTFSGRYFDYNNYMFSSVYNPENSRVDLSPAVTAFTGAAAAYITAKGGKVSKNQFNYGDSWSTSVAR